jgi:ATP-dependent Clp protease adaptor protein ClpS
MGTKTDYELKEETSLKYPKKYKVYLLNDDYTSMEFVVDILMSIFHKSYEQAEAIMLEVHKHERGLCGVYTHEIAETKVMQVTRRAKDSGFPLKATMEEE